MTEDSVHGRSRATRFCYRSHLRRAALGQQCSVKKKEKKSRFIAFSELMRLIDGSALIGRGGCPAVEGRWRGEGSYDYASGGWDRGRRVALFTEALWLPGILMKLCCVICELNQTPPEIGDVRHRCFHPLLNAIDWE